MKATMKSTLFFTLLCFISLLTGCSSGSSSSSGSSGGGQTIPIFASWDSVSPSSSIQTNSITISSDEANPSYEDLLLDFDADAILEQITIGSDAQKQIFERDPFLNIIDISGLSLFKKSSDAKDWLVSFSPDEEVWKYQSMALWLDVKDSDDDVVDIDVGVLSFGDATESADIPDEQDINFAGTSIGLFIDVDSEGNKRYLTQATIDATFLRDDNTIELEATDTYRWNAPSFDITNIGSNISTQNDKTRDTDLDFMTTLTYNSSDNSFDAIDVETTDVDATDKTLQGAVKAQFYGEEAQELGGVFRINGVDGSSYSGAFGTKIKAQ